MRYVLCFLLLLLAVNLTAVDLPDSTDHYHFKCSPPDTFTPRHATYNALNVGVVCNEVVVLDSLGTRALGYDRAYTTLFCDTLFVLTHRRF